MSNSKRNWVVFSTLLAVFSVVYILIYNYFNSVSLVITAKHTISIQVLNAGSVVGSFGDSSAEVRVPKNSTITIKYTSENQYSNGSRSVSIHNDKATVNIDPYFSTERLASLLPGEKEPITNVILSYKTNIKSLYAVQNLKLHHFGDWASAKLVWKGEYSENSDTLRVILQKEGEKWVISGAPTILFYEKNYPNIPVDILKAVNDS